MPPASSLPPAPDPALTRLLADATARTVDRVLPLAWNGRRVWVKRAAALRPRRAIALQAALALLLSLPMLKPPRQRGGAEGLAAEADALRHLAAAGWPVPQALALDARHLVLSDVGQSLEHRLNAERDPAARQAMIEAAADLLQRLHASGAWHGGAQIRNFSWTDGAPGLLDLEDHDLPGMTAAECQARDLMLFLYSLTRYDAADGGRLLPPLAKRLVRAAAPETQQALRQLHRRIGWLVRLARPFAAKLGRDVRQALAAEQALAAALDA